MSLVYKMKKFKKNPWILWIWNEHRRIKGQREFNNISDEEYIKELYYKSFGEYPDLENPKTFNEKLQWLKLKYRNPDMVQCADKYEVRKYISDRGLDYLLNELIAVYDSVNEINLDELPERFVLKGSHGSGWNLIVKNKYKINWTAWKLIMNSWLKQNLYNYGREWVYKNIKPRIVCEKYLEDSNGELLDYKVLCFKGEPKLIQVDKDRFNNRTTNYYNTNWQLTNLKIGYENSGAIKKPTNFDEMMRIAKILSKDFPFVRVDFYEVDGKLYFGELTFYPFNGIIHYEPNEYNYKLGEWLILPEVNTNFLETGENEIFV